jgi:hypothetical protein
MSRSFPRAVWACIAEGRIPFQGEIEAVTAKVLHEAFGGRSGSWEHRVAARIAEAALFGARVSTT